jgi:hypothetical protein
VDLAVPKDLQEEFRTVKSRAELEAKRDFIRNETFRRDIWIKGEPLQSEEEWLEINQNQIFGTLEPLGAIDKAVAFGDLQLSYENEPFAGLLKVVATRATSVREMEAIPGLAGLSPWTRAEAARLLAAGGQVMGFAQTTKVTKVPKSAKLSITPANRGLIKELGMILPRLALSAPKAGTGIEITNIDAVLLLALCDRGSDSAVKLAAKLFGTEAGDVIIGGKKLTPADVEKLLTTRLKNLEATMLDKLVELGVVAIEA